MYKIIKEFIRLAIDTGTKAFHDIANNWSNLYLGTLARTKIKKKPNRTTLELKGILTKKKATICRI